MARRPADPEEELRWMSQEVRGYVEAVLNSLAANVPKVCDHPSFSPDSHHDMISFFNFIFLRRFGDPG